MKSTIAFTAGSRDTLFYRLPAGRSLLIILAAQTLIVWVPPAAVAGLSALLLLAAVVARRPVHSVLAGAWPVLLLALLTALRSDSAATADRITVFVRFCFMIVAADLYVTSFAWQPALARLSTSTLHGHDRETDDIERTGTIPVQLDRGRIHRTIRRVRSRMSGSVATVALALWLAVLHIPGVTTRLRARREAALARGIPLRHLLGPAALSSLLTELLSDADTRAEAIAARGLLSENTVPGKQRLHR